MIAPDRPRRPPLIDRILDPLRGARELDPDCGEERLRDYFHEIVEATAMLGEIEVHDAPVAGAFNPSWPGEHER
jgi:hypothetical protein